MKIVVCIIFTCVRELLSYQLPQLKSWDHDPVRRLINTSSDIIQHTDRQVAILNPIRKIHSDNAAFEIGYLSFVLQEKYRRMVDRYNVSATKGSKFYLMEHVLFLKEIEQLYWDVQHLSNMLHEVERKYNISSPMDVEYVEETTRAEDRWASMPHKIRLRATKRKKYKRKHKSQAWEDLQPEPPKPQNKNKWWPIDYGWEIDYYW
ncbi:uncharacterized protein LOC121736461 isoform X2 [Aricia agestis]|uniref:uncharacterized protein LOC121736461 isoform X2 n=1 Tax=Aricia agestis TaxID=91739 RepID=UPI001C20482B|nr:uncharacterized protein LOC121736461 isoform X2 [Aricia agestis]